MADAARDIDILHVVGTRPNFMKIAPIMRAVDAWNSGAGGQAHSGLHFSQRLVHTGQHYDREMSAVFFDDLGLREPDVYLNVGSGTQAAMTASLLTALEPVIGGERPDLVLVVGDVNTTLAAALVAAKMSIPVAHVEAGLRSHDRRMPEEVNRVLTDHISDLLFTTSEAAGEGLRGEGVAADTVRFVGNTMIDCLQLTLPLALQRGQGARLTLTPRDYAVVTLHRPSNVDDAEQLCALAETLLAAAERLPVVFPVHVRTRNRLQTCGALPQLEADPRVQLIPPAGYIDFLSLLAGARVILTDSGGIQAESCVLGTPCLTLRTTTEWPETIAAGINQLVDPYDGAGILAALDQTLAAPLPSAGASPPLWDGHAAERIVAALAAWAAARVV
jgi:UDP-N-acetylglucosamine 2-epimerase (non-hydrolysing)